MEEADTDNLLEEVFDSIQDIGLETEQVRFVYLFGSYIEDAESARDIDICISIESEKPEKVEMKLNGRLRDHIDLSVFEVLPLHVKKQVFSGELLYSRDKSVYDQAFQTFRDFESFQPLYKTTIGVDT